ncbi:MAG: hypothetical protein Q9213_000839 [Squamulea squamosa]
MAASQPISSNFSLASAEDPMDVYPGGMDDPAHDDGIDIDLDLTNDRRVNRDDDEMIEDFDADVEDMNPDTELILDEPMIDDEVEDGGADYETVEDAYPEQDEDLDDLETTEISGQLYTALNSAEGAPQNSESNLDALQEASPHKYLQNQYYLDHPPNHEQVEDRDSSPNDNPLNVVGTQVGEVPVTQDFPRTQTAVSTDKPAERGHGKHTTLDHIDDRIHNAQTSSLGSTSEPHKPPTSVEEQQIYAELNLSGKSKSVGKTTQANERLAGMLAETSVKNAQHDLNSPKSGNSSQDGLPQTSVTKGANDTKELSNTQIRFVSPNTGIFHVSEQNHNEPIPSEANISNEPQTVKGTLHVHPVTVKYQYRKMYLFPPTEDQKDHDKYFLSDETLAAEGIQSLFKGFRNFLGQSISNAEDLEISFDDLDLCVSESNIETANINLIQILDIYRQLHYNESDQPPKPMLITLSTNVRFVDRLNYLEKLATEGVGLSQLTYEDSSANDASLENQPIADEAATLEPSTESPHLAHAKVPAPDMNDKQPKSPIKDTPVESPVNESASTNGSLTNDAGNLAEEEFPTLEGIDPGNVTDLISKGTATETVAASNTSDVSASANQLDPETPSNMSRPQTSDAVIEDFGEEQYYEDEIGFEIEENEYPDEEQSAGSSTVQGDDSEFPKDDVESSNDVSVLDDPLSNIQQQQQQPPPPPPCKPNEKSDAKDVISYETDEDDNADYAEDAEHAEDDLQWHDNDEANPVNTKYPESNPAALQNTDGSSLPLSNYNKDPTSNVLNNLAPSVQGPNASDTDRDHFRKDHKEQVPGLYGLHKAMRKTDAVANDVRSCRTDEAAAPLGLMAQTSVFPAEEEDEITFDDEAEEEAEESAGASAYHTFLQTARSSPSTLKRARGFDETVNTDDSQSK